MEKALSRLPHPTLYTKEVVTIATPDGEQTAMLYVMAKQYEDMPALPNEHYFEIIRQGYQDNEINTGQLIKALKITRDEIVNK